MNEIKKEIIELMILFFIIFFGLIWVDIGNRELIHKEAVYQAGFNLDFEIPTGFEDTIVRPD